jgi:hypothetical protein
MNIRIRYFTMNKQIIIRDQEQQPCRTRSRQQTEQKMKGL